MLFLVYNLQEYFSINTIARFIIYFGMLLTDSFYNIIPW